MGRKGLAFLVLLAAAVLFVAVNILTGLGLGRARVDLTENRVNTLAPGSLAIAAKLDEPVRLKLYFSRTAATGQPQFLTFADRVKDVLRNFERASGGKLKLEEIDPEPFSQEEEDAAMAGLIGAPFQGSRLFFGLVGSNATDKREIIPFFDPAKEGFLEYDVTRLIYLLSNPPKKVVGVMTWLPIEGGSTPFSRQPQPAWYVYQRLREFFDVRVIQTDAAEIPADIRVLVVVHPKSIKPQAAYAIDQFVMRGGRLLLFVDPFSEVDVPPGMDPMQLAQMADKLPRSSDLQPLLGAWGLELIKDEFAADRQLALPRNVGGQGRPEIVNYVAWVQVRPANMAKDPVTSDMQGLILSTAGILKPVKGAETTVTPLIETTTESMAKTTAAVAFFPDPKRLLAEFQPGGSKLMLAARVTGKAKSAFPNGKPQDPVPAGQPPAPDPKAGHLAEAAEPINVIVVADVDMLNDMFWVAEDRRMPGYFQQFADNGEFVKQAVDTLGGSSDLLSVRPRLPAARPFERVQAMEKAADQKFQQEQQELERKEQQTVTRINELQKKSDGSKFMFSPEQVEEIKKLQKERADSVKQRRSVLHERNREVDALGLKLKIINIAAVPVAVGLLAVGLAVYRVNRRRTSRWSAEGRT